MEPQAQGNPIIAGANGTGPVRRYKSMRAFAICCIVAAAILLSACTHARVTTRIQSDGSWTRTVVLTGPQKKDGLQPTPGATLDDTFVVPTGSGWKSSEEAKDNNRMLTLERTLAD